MTPKATPCPRWAPTWTSIISTRIPHKRRALHWILASLFQDPYFSAQGYSSGAMVGYISLTTPAQATRSRRNPICGPF